MNDRKNIDTCDLLIGMKAICEYLNVSESTVKKWQQTFDDFPIKKAGRLISSRKALNDWAQKLFS